MNILGIETSCDETAAAVVQNGKKVLSNIVSSSLKEHAPYGGIVPEIASRRQLECINRICTQSLLQAGLELHGIDAIAVTHQPGLIGSLLVGVSFARALSFAAQKPLIHVDHIKAHAYANFLKCPETKPEQENRREPHLPAVALIVSGGHTQLYYIRAFDAFKLLGETVDDAAGEAFDKVAKILHLGYPGGPAIDRLAKKASSAGPRFACAQMAGSDNFSFSGLKTAVLYHYQRHKHDPSFSLSQTAYSFQESVISILIQKSLAACLRYKTKTLLIGGGVAANSSLRKRAISEARRKGIEVHVPPMPLCTDNAAMIAGLAFHLIKTRKDKRRDSSCRTYQKLPLKPVRAHTSWAQRTCR